jgi:hypothetical protein
MEKTKELQKALSAVSYTLFGIILYITALPLIIKILEYNLGKYIYAVFAAVLTFLGVYTWIKVRKI